MSIDEKWTTDTQYRLSWESPSTIDCATVETHYGRSIWPRFDWDNLTSWHSTSKITDNPWQQYNQLKAWAESREQPIRNVKLEQRQVPLPDEGWELVQP